jgi:hypothetical protein
MFSIRPNALGSYLVFVLTSITTFLEKSKGVASCKTLVSRISDCAEYCSRCDRSRKSVVCGKELTNQVELDILFLEYAINESGGMFSVLLVRQASMQSAVMFVETFSSRDEREGFKSAQKEQNITMYPSSVRETHSGTRSEETSMF